MSLSTEHSCPLGHLQPAASGALSVAPTLKAGHQDGLGKPFLDSLCIGMTLLFPLLHGGP
eukprot:4289512-Amphidinium_carterae.2